MATPQEVADALAVALRTISGLRVYDTASMKPEVPAACVLGPTTGTGYDESFDGLWRPVFEVEVFVNAADPSRGQQALRAYVAPTGAKSIPAAIYGDPTLGGVVNFARVVRVTRNPVLVDSAGGQVLSTALAVEMVVAA